MGEDSTPAKASYPGRVVVYSTPLCTPCERLKAYRRRWPARLRPRRIP